MIHKQGWRLMLSNIPELKCIVAHDPVREGFLVIPRRPRSVLRRLALALTWMSCWKTWGLLSLSQLMRGAYSSSCLWNWAVFSHVSPSVWGSFTRACEHQSGQHDYSDLLDLVELCLWVTTDASGTSRIWVLFPVWCLEYISFTLHPTSTRL